MKAAIIFLLVSTAGLFSCRVVKSSKVSATLDSVVVHDTVRVKVAIHDSFIHEKYVHDTTIGIPGNDVTVQWLAGSVVDTSLRKGNVSLHVYNDSKGQQHIDCKADSITAVLHYLISERDQLLSEKDSSYTDGQHSVLTHDSTVTDTTIKGEPWYKMAINYLIAAIIGVLVWEIGKVVFKILKAV
jgi:ElaB/YqjD/DUF883 family membrane-anchored ribosome-binding protein